MNFHETVMGRTFYQAQLPKLIAALSDIAQAIKAPRPVYQVQQTVPPDFLAELYQGNFDPSDVPETPDIAGYTREITQYQKQLRADLSHEVWERIETYRSLLDARQVKQLEQAFAAGFRCAATMLAAGLAVPPPADVPTAEMP